jgi:dynein light intermediate chain
MLALKLQQKLKERQARVKGICDVRYEIYDEAFNELIRQVAINCPERGIPKKNILANPNRPVADEGPR